MEQSVRRLRKEFSDVGGVGKCVLVRDSTLTPVMLNTWAQIRQVQFHNHDF